MSTAIKPPTSSEIGEIKHRASGGGGGEIGEIKRGGELDRGASDDDATLADLGKNQRGQVSEIGEIKCGFSDDETWRRQRSELDEIKRTFRDDEARRGICEAHDEPCRRQLFDVDAEAWRAQLEIGEIKRREIRTRPRRGAWLAVTLACMTPAAHAAPTLHDVMDTLDKRLSQLDAARGPHLVAPVPIAVAWQPRKLAPSLDLDAPLVALAAGDLDGDGKAELYAVTTRDVIALAISGNRVREIARVALVGEPASHRPRDPVGAAFVDGKRLIASASTFARAVSVRWSGKQLVAEPDKVMKPGIASCAGEVSQLAPGRDYFADNSYGTRCRDDLTSGDGHPLHVRGQLALDGKLRVVVETCEPAGNCGKTGEFSFTKVGVGFDFADLDHDGTPEAIFAGAGAPGEPDELRVVGFGDDEHKAKLRKAFSGGGVVAIAVDDFEHKVPVAIAAVRLEGSARVDLWRMN